MFKIYFVNYYTNNTPRNSGTLVQPAANLRRHSISAFGVSDTHIVPRTRVKICLISQLPPANAQWHGSKETNNFFTPFSHVAFILKIATVLSIPVAVIKTRGFNFSRVDSVVGQRSLCWLVKGHNVLNESPASTPENGLRYQSCVNGELSRW